MKPNSSFNPSRHLCSGLFAALIFSAGVFEASADNNESVLTANVFDQVQYHIFAFVIGLMAAILLVRTFTGKDNSRYLIHIAIAFGIISLSHLISTGISLMQLFTSVPADQIRRLSEKTDLLLSCLSTFFFILSFVLLLRFPSQSVPPEIFAGTTAVLGVFVALVTLIQGPVDDSTFLKAIDIITSLAGVICVGVGLVRIANGQISIITGWIAACSYCIWGIAQLPFWFDYVKAENHQFYFYSLSIVGLASAITTVIFSALSLPDRPRFAG
jgi:hypothetical protein